MTQTAVPSDRERLFRRFALTIPTGRTVRVRWRLFLHETEDRITVGRPHRDLAAMIYVSLGRDLVAIPKACVLSIDSAVTTA